MKVNHKISIHSDGTLEVTVPEGTDVKRVLVSEAGTNYGSLYYPDEGEENDSKRSIIRNRNNIS